MKGVFRMTPTHIKGPQADSDMRELVPKSARKPWRRPELRKLPISATAGSKGTGNEGMGPTKSGDANVFTS